MSWNSEHILQMGVEEMIPRSVYNRPFIEFPTNEWECRFQPNGTGKLFQFSGIWGDTQTAW
jgi:hypothetical protein